MKKLKSLLKAIYRTGGSFLAKPGLICTYHRVNNLENDHFKLAVSPDRFRLQLKLLSERFQITSLAELVENPRGKVAITFDDGYADNLLQLLPILEELKVHATIFITTGLLSSTREAWWDHITSAILSNPSLPTSLVFNGETYDVGSLSARMNTVEQLHGILGALEPQDREIQMAKLDEASGYRDFALVANRMLTQGELIKLANSPYISIGAHTHTHTRLSVQSYADQLSEMQTSRQILEKILGRSIDLFSYPFGGRRDINSFSKAAAKASGFSCAAANYPNFVFPWTNKFSLPRFVVRDWNAVELTGFLDSIKSGSECEYY